MTRRKGEPMPNKLNLFSPASRRTDPKSSHSAERGVNQSGSREIQQKLIYDYVQSWPGRTSLEMTERLDLDRYQIARRLADLKNAGLVYQGASRKCRIGGRDSVTWWPVRICARCGDNFDQHISVTHKCVGFKSKE